MTFWSDFKARFKNSPAEGSAAPAPVRPAPTAVAPLEQQGWLARWRTPSKRDRQIAWLQAGYSEMLDLMRVIREHLEGQADVQQKMVGVLEKLPDSMDGLKTVGKAAEQQVEVLALLRRQIESSVNHDQQLVESMNRFNQTLGLLDETSRTSGRTVIDLVEKSRESEKLLRDVVERSERRILLVISLFVVVLLIGVGAAMYVATGGVLKRAQEQAVPAAVSITAPLPEPAAAAEPVAPAEKGGWFGRLFHGSARSSETPADAAVRPEGAKP